MLPEAGRERIKVWQFSTEPRQMVRWSERHKAAVSCNSIRSPLGRDGRPWFGRAEGSTLEADSHYGRFWHQTDRTLWFETNLLRSVGVPIGRRWLPKKFRNFTDTSTACTRIRVGSMLEADSHLSAPMLVVPPIAASLARKLSAGIISGVGLLIAAVGLILLSTVGLGASGFALVGRAATHPLPAPRSCRVRATAHSDNAGLSNSNSAATSSQARKECSAEHDAGDECHHPLHEAASPFPDPGVRSAGYRTRITEHGR